MKGLIVVFGNIISLAIYVVSAFAFYKIGKLRGIEYPWMAFVPFFSLYIIGYIGDTLKYNTPKLNKYLFNVPLSFVLPGALLVSSFSYMVPLVGGLLNMFLNLAVYVGQLLIYYMIFEHYADSNQKILFTLLSIIPVVGPLLVLYCIKDQRVY